MSTDNTDDSKSIGYRDGDTLQRMYWGEEMCLSEIAEHFDVVISTIERWMKKNGIERRRDGRRNLLNGCASIRVDGMGYVAWRSKLNGEESVVRVHQLLAISEGESPYDVFGGENHVHHKNGIPWDNRPENLELKSSGEHASEHHAGERNANSVLTETDVKEIRERYDNGEEIDDIEGDYPVHPSTVDRVARGVDWTHVG